MAIVPSDLPVQWSVEFETLFLAEYNQTVAVERAKLDPLLMEIPLGDHQGNKVTIDWLGAAPQMRPWKDEKRPGGLSNYTWEVEVQDYEASLRVNMNALKDARFNPYEQRIREMSQNAARLTYNLVSDLIKSGAAKRCYDGQYFFDVDHLEGESGYQPTWARNLNLSVVLSIIFEGDHDSFVWTLLIKFICHHLLHPQEKQACAWGHSAL